MLKNMIKEYIWQNRKVVIGLCICIIIGIVSGLFAYYVSSKEVKDILISQMTEAINLSDNGEFVKKDVIYNGIRYNFWFILIMFVFSIMLYGTILIYFIYIIKGLSLGIYIGTLFGIFGFWWGIVAIMCLVFLVNVVYLPAIVFIGTTLINYNLGIMEYRKDVRKVVSFSSIVLKLVLGIMIIFSSIIVEQLMSNIVIRINGRM